MGSFNDSIEKLLWPEKREKDSLLGDKVPGRIDRTTQQSWVYIPVGYLPEVPALYPALSVAANLRFSGRARGCGSSAEVDRVMAACRDSGALYGLSILNDGKYSFDVDVRDIGLTVLRSPIYAHHDPMRANIASRSASVSIFESRILYTRRSFGRTAAPTVSGPAHAPRPTSSMPTTMS